jgi:hypothetical protein
VPGLKIKNLESKDPRFFLQQIKRGRILLELHALVPHNTLTALQIEDALLSGELHGYSEMSPVR